MTGASGPPREPLYLPGLDAGAEVLQRLGVEQVDRAGMLAARPSPIGTPYLWWRLERAYRQLAARTDRIRWTPLPAPYLYPWALVARLPWVRAYHTRHGIPDDVSWATLADLGRHLRLGRLIRGRPGALNAGWLTPHYRGRLYQLGRLQYIRAPSLTALVHYPPVDGPTLDLHIPEMGPLTPGAVDGSLAFARDFFARYFPGQRYRFAHCNSWLLDPQLARYLPANSNIVAFQRRFQLVPVPADQAPADLAVLEFVFHRERKPLQDNELASLPTGTSLARAIVTHLSAGGHWYFRPGWFAL